MASNVSALAEWPKASKRLRLSVLASGRGSNLAAILDACRQQRLAAEVVGVFSDKARSGAIGVAEANAVPACVVIPADYPSRDQFDAAMFAKVDATSPDLIVCAGFMRILGADAVAPRSQRMINVHPSLLPLYPGLHTHQRALAAGDREHGASVHFVIPALDAGPVIAQTRIRIEPDDSAESLAARLLPAEHELLIATIALFCTHQVQHAHGQVWIDDAAQSVPRRF